MPNTDQHGWPYPNEGDADYENTFDQFFEQIDDAVEIRAEDSKKGNYTPVTGAKFVATDTEKVYIGDGSTWNHLTTTGKTPSFDSVDTDQEFSTTYDLLKRSRQISVAQKIRDEAGVPDDETAGIEDGVTVGLTDATALSAQSRIAITSESEASTAADSGNGTEGNPYVIRDRQLDNSEATSNISGVNWDDSDASYYLKLVNCEISGYDYAQIRASSSARLTVENCLIYSGGTATFGADAASGDTRFVNTEFAGCGDDALRAANSGTNEFRNCRFTESQETWGASNGVQTLTAGTTVDIRHCEVTAPSLGPLLRMFESATVKLRNTLANSITNLLSADNGENFDGESEVRYCRTVDTDEQAIHVIGGANGNLEVSYSEFDDNAAGTRLVYFNKGGSTGNQPTDIRVHHCKLTKTTGSGSGDECLESRLGVNVSFDHCWVTEAPEDAFEHIQPDGCSIEYCVADNCDKQVADIYRGASGAGSPANSYVHHIYGESANSVGLVITDADSVYAHDIYVSCPNGSGINLEQRDGTAGATPDNCVIEGPLPLPDVVSGSPFTTTGSVGSNNYVAYADNAGFAVPLSAIDHAAMQSRINTVISATSDSAQDEIR